MPPRRAPRAITSIKRTGELDADFTIFENKFITNRIEELEDEIDDQIEIANAATIKRRGAVAHEEDNSKNNLDIFIYLSNKKKEKTDKLLEYEKKLQDAREAHKNLQRELQNKMDKLKKENDNKLKNQRKALEDNIAKKNALKNAAAEEAQLKLDIEKDEKKLAEEERTQSMKLTEANKEFSRIISRQREERATEVEKEKSRNRDMTKKNLEDTVIKMMQEKNDKKNELEEKVKESKTIADENTRLMEKNKQLYMKRDLLQSESESLQKRITSNDEIIKSLVEELKETDQRISNSLDVPQEEIESSGESSGVPSNREEEEYSPHEEQPRKKGREQILNEFFDDSVNTLCTSIVKVLQVIDAPHAQDYLQFHYAFNSFEERKRELRFLMSKLGNLTFEPDSDRMLPPIGLEAIEGVDEDYTKKNLIDPQNKAIMEFAGPIGDEEYPDLIATHFFQ